MPHRMNTLVLLGVWNVLPLEAWPWFCDAATGHFKKLTKRRLRVFTYVEDDLHYECFLPTGVEQLKNDLEKLSTKAQHQYVKKICRDYATQAKPLVRLLKFLKNKSFRNLDDHELVAHIKQLTAAWPKVTMQVWYAVLLDLWYPSLTDKLALKKMLARMRDHCGQWHAHSKRIETKLYTEVARRLNMSVYGVNYLFPDEIIKALQTNESQEHAAHQRMQLCVTTDVSGHYQIYHGRAIARRLSRYGIPRIGSKKQRQLSGFPAQPGRARGRVRKILLDSEFGKFKQGEILVALQTMVHYLSIMKKAKAILTEFGGLTSHAAIVSRELSKPCIVGIPNLITSLKDGDRVEVDAGKGVVRKLN